MPRPSRQLDQALLAAGRELFPRSGCGGLTVRALARHAGVQVGMFHYHFDSKDAFLRTLLQQMYDGMYRELAAQTGGGGAAIDRLRRALCTLGRFARDHRATIGRVWIDAMQGEPVALGFMRENAPRHVGVLLALAGQAARDGALRPLPPLQGLMLMLGGVALPMIFVGGLADAQAAPMPQAMLAEQVMDDAAIAERVDCVLAALSSPPPPAVTPAPVAPRRRTTRPRRPAPEEVHR